MGWQCSLWSSPVARVIYPFFFFSFPSPSLSLSFSDHSGHRRRDRRPMWDSEKLYLTSPPCPPFLYPLSWPFPHPSVPLLLFSGHRRRDMQIRCSRQPKRLSRRPRAALPIFSLFIFVLFLYFFFPLRQPSSRKLVFCHLFHSFFCLLFSLSFSNSHSGHRRRDMQIRSGR